MDRWIRYKALVKVYMTSYFSTLFFKNRLNKQKATDGKSKAKEVFGAIAIGVSLLFIVAILVSSVISLTISAIDQGYFDQLPYLIVGASQLSILLLGGNIVLSYLYFSEDGQLILSLPIASGEAYAAKFTVSYLSQLFLSAFFIPVFVAFGVTASMEGVAIQPSFYVLSVLSMLLVPAFPTFAMGVFSAPLMFLIKIFKNKERAKTVVTVISSALGMILYFVIVFSTSFYGDPETEGGIISPNMVSMIIRISKFFIFNHHFCQALLGNNVALNTLFYVLECIGSMLLAVVLCAFFFRKILYLMGESSVSGKKARVKGDPYVSKSVGKTLFIKDFKLIFKTPTLLFSTILGIILAPVITIISHNNMFKGAQDELSNYGMELISLGITFYVSFIMLAASNSVTGVSISVEKNNFTMLKTLPLSGERIVRSKLKVSYVITGLICLTTVVAYLFSAVVALKPVFALLLCGALFLSGCGLSVWEIMRDLEKPNFHYTNVNELTRNNKRMMLPILLSTFIGIFIMIAGILMGSILPSELIYIGYIVFFALIYVLALLLFFLSFSSMKKKADDMYEKLEV